MDNWACAARADQNSMGELIKSNAALVRANKRLAAEVTKSGGMVRNLHAQLSRMAKLANQPAPAPLENARPRSGDDRARRGGAGRGTGRPYTNKTGRGPGGEGACGPCGWADHLDARCYERPDNASRRPSNWKICV